MTTPGEVIMAVLAIVQPESSITAKVFAEVRSGVLGLGQKNTDAKNDAILTDAFRLRLVI